MADRENGVGFGKATMLPTVKYQTAHENAPNADWSHVHSGEHFVQFYKNHSFIVDSAAEYFIHGLRSGGTCIAAATREHLGQIAQKIVGYGIDLKSLRKKGKYIELSAEEALPMIMINDIPDPALFQEVIGKVVGRSVKKGQDLRIFGELVAVLCTSENYAAAASLENLWENLRKEHPFSLFCAYATARFNDNAPEIRMMDICRSHSVVIPDESYTSLTTKNERLRKIAALQQRVKQLESELSDLSLKAAFL
jgi:hypothetical protein